MMFTDSSIIGNDKEKLLNDAKQAREERARSRIEIEAAVTIQAVSRGFLSRKRLDKRLKAGLDELIVDGYSDSETYKTIPLPSALSAFKAIRQYLIVFQPADDKQRFVRISRYLLSSIDSKDLKTSCISVALTKENIMHWVKSMKSILWQAAKYLEELKTELAQDMKEANLFLTLLVSLTSCNSWALLKSPNGEALKGTLNQLCSNILNDLVAKGLFKKLSSVLCKGLCRTKPTLRNTSISAILTLSLRPLMNNNFVDSMFMQFVSHILTVPALLHHLHQLAQECVALLMSQNVFTRTVRCLTRESTSRVIFDGMDGLKALALLANIIHLGSLHSEVVVENLLDFTNVVTRIVEKCAGYVLATKKAQTSRHFHPVLGWFSQPIDPGTQASMRFLVAQLQRLWSKQMVETLFGDLVHLLPPSTPNSPTTSSQPSSGRHVPAHFKVLFRSLVEKNSQPCKALGSPESTAVALVCLLYQSALSTFAQLRFDILSGLCHSDFLLPRLWQFMCGLGPQNGLKAFLHLMTVNSSTTSPEFQILILFCDLATYLITILDDMELYEQEKPFKVVQLTEMAVFTNTFFFKAIWGDAETWEQNPVVKSVHGFLMLLYHRNSRRPFLKDNNANIWLIKDVKPSVLISEFEKGNKKAEVLVQKVPHIVPLKERIVLFRKYIQREKDAIGGGGGVGSQMITVHRPRILEDAYRQLSLLSTPSLKGTIRVRFVNEQGLDEAGIDQDGVFKEFLEEAVKSVTHPSLNLFKRTKEGNLYPSASSDIHDNHLALFDFCGRLLAKALYENIVVDVPLSSFFLRHLLGKSSGLGYSSIDELPSLDPDLYKSLTYIKHYTGDVSELELTFSCDEDCMGQLVTHDLVPGGRTIPVNNDNKISYIHRMAHFRMFTQIKDQIQSFVKGFRAIISPPWMALFSPNEFQTLMCGESEDFDVGDLRRNTQYYGGFHNNHRLINWLWDLLSNDFSPAERRLFLKFCTSCSKPPLLGFSELDPPFSIRCVEVGDDQDEGDTLGSVLRGFLAIGKNREPVGRLPTSSTCFNLLKLPNYNKKSTLREKLRYAIHSNTGFELS